MAKTVAVDFDGVIHAYSKGWYDGTIYDNPVMGSHNAIEQLQCEYAVAIFTTRDANQVAEWLRKKRFGDVTTVWTPPFWNDREHLLVTNVKPAAIAYIDDRAIRFVDWRQAMNSLRAFTK